MDDQDQDRDQLLAELRVLRQRVADLEALETARRQTEEALRQERDLVARIVETRPLDIVKEGRDRAQKYLDVAGVMLMALNERGEIILMNRKGHAILGYKEGELLGRNWFDTCLPARHREQVRIVFHSLLAGKSEPAEIFENPVLTQAGEERVIAWRNTLLTDDQGRIVGTLSSGEDITDRRRIEAERERLLLAERRQRELAETLREVASTLNSNLGREQLLALILEQLARVVEFDNASIMLISGDLLEIAAQRGFVGQQRLLPPLRIVDLAHVQEVLHNRRPGLIEDVQADPGWLATPESRHVRCWLGVPLVAQGEVLGLLNLGHGQPGFCTPEHGAIAQAFADQASVAIANARLLRDMQAAYEELRQAQAQLVQSAKMAAIGGLAAGVAHELNNPLTSVLGFAELVMHRVSPDNPIQRDLATIVAEARRARDVVRNLLAFSRQSESFFERADVNQVLRETLALIRQQIEDSGVALDERYADDLPPIRLANTRMKQVFLNLLTNALHAMPQGGTLAALSQRVGDEIVVRIADTGTGIPPDDLPHIFDPFFTTKPAQQGTGLGLAISLSIVQEHGGRIEVESRLGPGSTFAVWLPVQAALKKVEHGG